MTNIVIKNVLEIYGKYLGKIGKYDGMKNFVKTITKYESIMPEIKDRLKSE